MPRIQGSRPRVIGDISIYPIGEGTSVGRYVREAFHAMESVHGVRLVPGAMSTVIEAENLPAMLTAVRKAHARLLQLGAQRIAINLRIDHRLDKPETIEYKVRAVKAKL